MEEINCLNCPTMTSTQIDNLRENKIITLMDFISAPRELVVTSMEIHDEDYQRFRQLVFNYIQPCPVTLHQLANTTSKSTGILSFDRLLGGGLFPGDVIELYGENGTGKTQLCMYLASKVSRWGSGNSSVMYFDLKNDFSAKRLLELSGGDETGLENVKIFRVPNLERLLTRLDVIRSEFVGGLDGFYSRCKLLVVDSVPMAIYPAVQPNKFSWRYLPEKLMQKLEWMANHMKLTVVLINHAVKIRAPVANSSAPTVKAALGQYWKHKIKTRVRLSKLKVLSNSPDYYSGYLEKCSRGPCGETFYFCIKTSTIKGINVKPGEQEK